MPTHILDLWPLPVTSTCDLLDLKSLLHQDAHGFHVYQILWPAFQSFVLYRLFVVHRQLNNGLYHPH